MNALRRSPLLALGATLLSACGSFDQLRADDPSVSELEVAEAADSSALELTIHLRRILQRRSEYPSDVVVSAIDSLAQRRDRGALPEILALCADPEEEVRWHVALALHTLGGEEAERALEQMAESDPSALVRCQATFHQQ